MRVMADDVRVCLRFVLAYAVITFRNSIRYKVDLFVKLAGYPVSLVMAYYLWRVLFEGNMIQGYVFKDLLTYYLVTYFLTQMYPFVRMAREIRTEIFSGDVVVFLARGVPHWAVWIGRFLATASAYVVLVTPIALVLTLSLGQLHVDASAIVPFAVLMVLGLIIKGQLWYLIGISSYFTEENVGTVHLYQLAENLLSGAILPLFLFPDWITRLQAYLPFPYTLYVPVQALLHQTSWIEQTRSMAIGAAWCLALAWLIKMVSATGWRRFTAHGA